MIDQQRDEFSPIGESSNEKVEGLPCENCGKTLDMHEFCIIARYDVPAIEIYLCEGALDLQYKPFIP